MTASVPLGLWQDSDFNLHELEFVPGDRLLLITDGIVEVSRQNGEVFGEGRLMELLQRTARERPSEVVRMLARAVVEHRATPLLDDATAVCIDYRRR
ncbi:MAG TPA: SpoIIE family protein phosphatase [Egibacteraceae bacterium]|nr:SpoIIE family protein phosphatase [Egibacteraceae bacterium]